MHAHTHRQASTHANVHSEKHKHRQYVMVRDIILKINNDHTWLYTGGCGVIRY